MNTEEPRFLNEYCCPYCKIEWDDIWDCECNDKCPECNAEIEPSCSTNLNEGE